jgi:gliding motility-associated lipoprotein GldD
MIRYSTFIFLLISFCLACGEEPPMTPKPRAYPKVDLPERNFQAFDKDYCRFSFDYPTYTKVIQDTSFFGERPSNPCWFDIYYPLFDARIHFTYAPANNPQELDKLKNDAFSMVDKQNMRASYIEEIRIEKPDANLQGIAFDITGPAASPFQFYLTDNDQHFVRAALYFNTQINPDSLAPMYDFVKMDITQMIDSFAWED